MFDLFKKQEKVNTEALPSLAFPEAEHPSVLRAAALLHKKQKCKVVLVGNKSDIANAASTLRVDLDGMLIRDPAADESFEKFGNELYSLNQKNMDLTEAKEHALDSIYFAMLMGRLNQVDGIVIGVSTSNQKIFKPALRVFPEASRQISSFNVLSKGNFTCVFADCSMNANPDPAKLSQIALQTASSASKISINPILALLSFSTKGASQHFDAMKVREAVEIIREKDANIKVDGELQFDVAVHPKIAAKKNKDSVVSGDANVFIFPDLDAGNIALKVAQHFGEFEVLGPFAQGFSVPIGTVSEDCNVDEVYSTAQLTSLLADKNLKQELAEENDGKGEEDQKENLEDFEEEDEKISSQK